MLSLSIQNVGTVLVLVILTRKAEATYTYKCIHGNSIALVGLVGRKSTKKGLSLETIGPQQSESADSRAFYLVIMPHGAGSGSKTMKENL